MSWSALGAEFASDPNASFVTLPAPSNTAAGDILYLVVWGWGDSNASGAGNRGFVDGFNETFPGYVPQDHGWSSLNPASGMGVAHPYAGRGYLGTQLSGNDRTDYCWVGYRIYDGVTASWDVGYDGFSPPGPLMAGVAAIRPVGGATSLGLSSGSADQTREGKVGANFGVTGTDNSNGTTFDPDTHYWIGDDWEPDALVGGMGIFVQLTMVPETTVTDFTWVDITNAVSLGSIESNQMGGTRTFEDADVPGTSYANMWFGFRDGINLMNLDDPDVPPTGYGAPASTFAREWSPASTGQFVGWLTFLGYDPVVEEPPVTDAGAQFTLRSRRVTLQELPHQVTRRRGRQ